MKQGVVDAYNVAWFKLAECVTRREKERALGMYRLLAHSLNDSALAAQLEGDILLAFDVDEAVATYQRAADHYMQTGRFFKAACIYEHMLIVQSHKPDLACAYHEALIALYGTLHMDVKVQEHTQALLDKKRAP